MIIVRVLFGDGALRVADIRCVEAPSIAGDEERAPSTKVVIPLHGVFVRVVRTPGSPAQPIGTIGDPTRSLVFRSGEPYRVEHPVGPEALGREATAGARPPGLGGSVAAQSGASSAPS